MKGAVQASLEYKSEVPEGQKPSMNSAEHQCPSLGDQIQLRFQS